MNIEFSDSKMNFSFNTDDCYRIEHSNIHKSLGDGVKICEVVVRKGRNIIFIEAKSSFSNPENTENFDANVEEIYLKFVNSLFVYAGLLLNRPYRVNDPLPQNLKLREIKKKPIKCILIINSFRNEWLAPVDSALNNRFDSVKKAFLIDSFKVINHELALKLGLVNGITI